MGLGMPETLTVRRASWKTPPSWSESENTADYAARSATNHKTNEVVRIYVRGVRVILQSDANACNESLDIQDDFCR